MEWISLIGIIAAIFVFLWLSFKGLPMLFIAPVASIVIFFFNLISGDANSFSQCLKPLEQALEVSLLATCCCSV